MISSFSFQDFIAILWGAKATLALSAIAFTGGGLGGLLVALLRTSEVRPIRIAAAAYIDSFQGTPLLMQLFLVYYGLPVFGLNVGPWVAVSLGLTLNASAFLGEIWRGGIQAVPLGQFEAAKALGLGYLSRLRHVVLPQAFRLSLAPTIGFLVQLIKGTALAAIVGFVELTRSAQIVSSTTYRPLIAFGFAGLVYFLICFPISRYGARQAERFGITR
jgi:polar amino acid transport system permease protein